MFNNEFKKLLFGYAGGEALSKGLNLILMLVLPLVLSKSEFGIVGLLVAIEVLAIVLVGAGVPQAVVRIYPRLFRFKKRFVRSVFLGWGHYAALAYLITVLLTLSGLFESSTIELFPLISFISYIFLATGREILYALLRVEERQKAYLSLKFLGAFLRVLITVYLCTTLQSHEAFIYGSALSVLISLLVYSVFLFEGRREHVAYSSFSFKTVRRFGLPLVLMGIVGAVANYTDRYMVAWFLGQEAVGLYSYAGVLGGANFFFLNIVVLVFQPRFFALKRYDRTAEVILKKFVQVGLVLLLSSGLLFSFLYLVICWVYLPEYQNGFPLVVIFVLRSCLLPFYLSGSYRLMFFNKSEAIPIPSTIACLLNFLLNLWLIPSSGLVGAAVATLISEVVLVVTIRFLASKVASVVESRPNLSSF